MMRCPHCEALRDPTDERQFKRLNMAKKYKHELNVVYVCVRHTGGCGHVFSPGNPEIVAAYLAGQLVPVEYVTNNKEERR